MSIHQKKFRNNQHNPKSQLYIYKLVTLSDAKMNPQLNGGNSVYKQQ